MKWWNRIRRFFASVTDNPGRWFSWPGWPNNSGVNVTPNTALTYASVWQATNVLSGDVAMLPCKLYRRTDEQNKEIAREHPAYRLIRSGPNNRMSWFTFVQTLQAQALLLGNGYALIDRNRRGEPVGLMPLMADRTEPFIENGRLWYRTRIGSDRDKSGREQRVRVLNPSSVLHIVGLGWDGLAGHDVITLARDSWGLGLAQQQHGARYFKNYATPQGLLKVPDKPSEDDAKQIKRDWQELTSGENAGGVAVLWGESDFVPVTINNENSQWLESRDFQRTEVASWFNLPPHKVGDLSRATFANIADQNRDYLERSLMRWLITWEQEMDRKLLTTDQQMADSYFFEFNTDAFLRGNPTERTAALKEQFMHGKITINEWRAKDNENSIGELGDLRFVPLNMVPLEFAAEGPQPMDPGGEVGGTSDNPPDDMSERDSQLQPNNKLRQVATDVLTTTLRGEAASIQQYARESKNFLSSMDGYYDRWQHKLADVIRALGGSEEMAQEYIATARETCLQVAGESSVGDFVGNIELAFSNFAAKAEDLAQRIYGDDDEQFAVSSCGERQGSHDLSV